MLELVNVHPKMSAIGFLLLLTSQSQLVEFRHQQRPQERRVLFTDGTMGQTSQEDLAAVHDVRKVESVCSLGDDVLDCLGPPALGQPRLNRPLRNADQP